MTCRGPLYVTPDAMSLKFTCDDCGKIVGRVDVVGAMPKSYGWDPADRVAYGQATRQAAFDLIHGAGKTVGDCAKCGAPVPCYYHDGVQP